MYSFDKFEIVDGIAPQCRCKRTGPEATNLISKPKPFRTAWFLLFRIVLSPAKKEDQAVDGFTVHVKRDWLEKHEKKPAI